MATYNGEKYIKEQITSILSQLGKDDELVVSDDGSTDKTLEYVEDFNDKRIKIFDGPKKGVKQNFANAIAKCKGDVIFLSDQDDVWLDNKVAIVMETFRKEKCQCVVHDAEVFESDTGKIIFKSFFEWRKSGPGIVKNIWKNTYIGCCMAFTKDMKKYILPVPDDINMHDQWIGLICEKKGESVFLPETLLKYRRHSSNQTKMGHSSVLNMLKKRVHITIRIIRNG
ncbi:glycosyltransferase family 2 protein [Candidatus Saccharibacteria bacterium]|nr:glycosyltransferase family 2 protein [Candidatus Saccharibacteria bacterium]